MAIDYTKTTWANGTAPALNATNLNNMEDGIEAACNGVDQLAEDVDSVEQTVQQQTQDIEDLGTNFNNFKLTFTDSNNDGNIVITAGGA